MVKRFLLYIFVTVLIINYLSADVDRDDFNIEVISGFDKFYTLNTWMPFTVLIETNLSSFSGNIIIEIPYGDLYIGSESTYSVSRDLFLTGGQQKVFQFTLPLVQSGVIEISVYKEERLIFQLEHELTAIKSDSHQLLIPGNSTDFDFLRQYFTDGFNKYQTNNIHTDMLPETAAGYSAINSIIIHDTKFNTFSESRSNALVNWIRNGGNLYITGNIAHSGDLPKFLSDILPVSIIGPVFSNLSSSKWFRDIKSGENTLLPIIKTRVRSGSKIMLEAGGSPLIINREEGYGNIFYISFNPGDTIYKNWHNRDTFWDYVFSLKKSEQSFFPVNNPLPGLNESLLSEIVLADSLKNSKYIYIIIPLIIMITVIHIKKIKGRIFLLIIITYPVIWSVLIVFFFTHPSPSYFEANIISTRLNKKYGHIFTNSTFAAHNPGFYKLKISTVPDLILPASRQSLSIENSELNTYIKLQMAPWSKRSFYMSSSYLTDFSGSVKKNGKNILIEIRNPDTSGLVNPIIGYKNLLTEDFILLHEKDKLYISFNINRSRIKNEISNNLPGYYINFLRYIEDSKFFESISSRNFLFLIMEMDEIIPGTNIDKAININKTFLVLEIPEKEFLNEN